MTAHYYSVIEDNAGGLHLYVFGGAAAETCVYACHGYERRPGALLADITKLELGDDTSAWDGDEDPQAAWDAWTFGPNGWTQIADEDGPVPKENMGAAGRREFYGNPDEQEGE